MMFETSMLFKYFYILCLQNILLHFPLPTGIDQMNSLPIIKLFTDVFILWLIILLLINILLFTYFSLPISVNKRLSQKKRFSYSICSFHNKFLCSKSSNYRSMRSIFFTLYVFISKYLSYLIFLKKLFNKVYNLAILIFDLI